MPPVDAPACGQDFSEIAYAKVNIALHVRERRADGYHALESLFAFASDGDLLSGRMDERGAIELTIDGPFASGLGTGADNLVIKAAHALRDHLGERRGAALALRKMLPVASGIGGGSADAAATLRLLNRLWQADVPERELERIALTLGSDVPACVTSTTQMVHGRGEVLEQRTVEGLSGTPMLLVNPGVPLSTARVFAGWDQRDRGPLSADSLDQLIAEGRNDLEQAAVAAEPVIAQLLDRLSDCRGVVLARMSGSGATCFALFADERTRATAARAIQSGYPDWWVMETETRAG